MEAEDDVVSRDPGPDQILGNATYLWAPHNHAERGNQSWTGSANTYLGATGSLLPVSSVAAEGGTGGQAASGTYFIRFASVAS